MTDFFDQDTGEDYEDDDSFNGEQGSATVRVNGSSRPLTVGNNFLESVKSVALQAGFGKFKVWLNGTEVRPSAVGDRLIQADDRVEIRPFDEAG